MTALNFPASPSNGDTYENYVYDSADGVWKRVPPGLDLEELNDVTITSAAEGQALVYNGSAWVGGGIIITAPNYDVGVTSATNPSTYDLDFSGDTGLYSIAVDQDLTITSSNYRAGSIKTLKLGNGASDRNLSLPASWRFIGERPTVITASKVAILSITSFGTSEVECVASYIEEA